MRDSREQLRALAAYLQSVREEERTHIARDVHDELGQTLTALKMDLAWLDKRMAEVSDGDLRVSVQDDGVGGADPALGSGLVGLTDRVEALGGTLALQSPRAGGTTLRIDLPLSG